jgi:hypothetical protein
VVSELVASVALAPPADRTAAPSVMEKNNRRRLHGPESDFGGLARIMSPSIRYMLR